MSQGLNTNVSPAGTATLTNKTLEDATNKFGDDGDTTKDLFFSLGGATTAKTMTIVSSHTDDRSLTLPDATDTLVGRATTDTLTNKSIAADGNTITPYVEIIGSSHTLTASECYGAVYYINGAATITLPAVAAGMNMTFKTIGAVAVSIDPNANDLIVLDGTAGSDNKDITNLSTAGDSATLTYYSAGGWYAETNGWTAEA